MACFGYGDEATVMKDSALIFRKLILGGRDK